MLEKSPEEMHLVDSAVCSFELQTSWVGFSENPPLDEAGFRVETLANGADCALILSPVFPAAILDVGSPVETNHSAQRRRAHQCPEHQLPV